jgi:uncharacterized protein YcbK (DUF882 family)
MLILQRRVVVAVASLGIVLFGLSASSWARTVRSKVHAGLRSSMRMKSHPGVKMHPVVMTGEEVVPGVMPDEDEQLLSETSEEVVPEDGKSYRLRMANTHTGETLDIVYRIGQTYIPDALDKLNYFLRDHNTQDVSNYDPKEFDVLHAMMSRLGRLNGMIQVVCGYRTPETNAALRQNSPWTGVAEHSQHMEGHAIDLRVPGASTAQIRNAALSLGAGGVGYYPVSQFVHVDVGPVREWTFGRSPRRVGRRAHRIRTAM